jgi:quercetin dioxygenase-like cupin family protein
MTQPTKATIMEPNKITPAEALLLHALVTPTENGIASRVLGKGGGSTLTLFAFDSGQALSEHSAPFDALVLVLEGSLILTIGGKPVTAAPGTIVRMPANVPHAVDAPEPSRMLLVMLREPKS